VTASLHTQTRTRTDGVSVPSPSQEVGPICLVCCMSGQPCMIDDMSAVPATGPYTRPANTTERSSLQLFVGPGGLRQKRSRTFRDDICLRVKILRYSMYQPTYLPTYLAIITPRSHQTHAHITRTCPKTYMLTLYGRGPLQYIQSSYTKLRYLKP
jgi:hypothetical protein